MKWQCFFTPKDSTFQQNSKCSSKHPSRVPIPLRPKRSHSTIHVKRQPFFSELPSTLHPPVSRGDRRNSLISNSLINRPCTILYSLKIKNKIHLACYKKENRGFDFQWGLQEFSLMKFFLRQYAPAVNSASNRN